MSAYSDFFDEVFKISGDLNETSDIVRDRWIKDKKYKELISMIIENWDSGNCVEFIQPLVEKLIEDKKLKLHKKIWHFVIRTNLKSLFIRFHNLKIDHPNVTWEQVASTDLSDFNPFWPKCYINEMQVACYFGNYTLNALKMYKKGAIKLGDTEEIKNIDAIIQGITDLNIPVRNKVKKATDKRKIDEDLFWELIEQSRNETEDKHEFIEVLTEKLSVFNATGIKMFQKLLLTFDNQLNDWRNWALAYIIRRGCGDDEFDYFKLWVISKGKFAFQTIKDFHISDFEKVFNLEDPQLEEFIYVAEHVYEENMGKFMKEPRVKSQKIKGTQFNENNICSEYPEVCKIFNFSSIHS